MYYDSIEEAIKAAPDCTHVLTTGSKWGSSPEQNPDVAGCYVAAVKHSNVFSPLNEEGKTTVDVTAYIAPTHWQVALDRTAKFPKYDVGGIVPQPTTTQRLAAARFNQHIPAHQFLESGVKHMKDRASQRDAEDGERSMRRCVEAFNALEGTNLTETQGWRFMIMLKMARSVSGDFTADDYEDIAAYSGLAGECASTQETTDTEQHSGVKLMESVSRYIINHPTAHWSDYKYFMKNQNKPYISEALYKSVHFALLQENS